MPNYSDLRTLEDFEKKDYTRVFPEMGEAERLRCIRGLLHLKLGLGSRVNARRTESNLLVASWNIKEFGHTTQRRPEAYFYIAEIIAAFDLVAVQEVKSTLKDLSKIMQILGDGWSYIVNDITDGTHGNSERSAYFFNTARVKLAGVAGEIALWDDITQDAKFGIKQLKRSPYMTGFKAGWKEFALINLHLHPGRSVKDREFRWEEVRLLLKALKAKGENLWTQNLILCGDMNFYDRIDDPALEQLSDAGYFECQSLVGQKTNAGRSQAFDRMLFSHSGFFQIVKNGDGIEQGGVFDPYYHVYTKDQEHDYAPLFLEDYGGRKNLSGNPEQRGKYYRGTWRCNQLSDHFPVWVELNIDDSAAFLASKLTAGLIF